MGSNRTAEPRFQSFRSQSFVNVGEYRTHSWPDVYTNAWKGIERISGKPWKELPDDAMVPAMTDPYQACIIVTGGGEEVSLWSGGRNPNVDAAYGIDVWR